MMRSEVPTSRSQWRLRLSLFDLIWVMLAPILALALRDTDLLNWPKFPSNPPVPYLFVFTAIAFAIPSLLVCRVSDAMRHTFSVQDFLAICAAVAMTIGSSGLVLFTLTRLDGVPRSTPLIYSLVLGSGLIGGRTFSLLVGHERAKARVKRDPAELRRVILIGADRFSWLIIKLLDSQMPVTTQIVSVLDEKPSSMGRSISGVRIAGMATDLGRIIDEYALHGVTIDAVWICDQSAQLNDAALCTVKKECAQRHIDCVGVASALNLAPKLPSVVGEALAGGPAQAPPLASIAAIPYFRAKRVIDIVASLVLIIALAPVWLLVPVLVLLDVGAPVHFWQERLGRAKRRFLVFKFRTYPAPFDEHGEAISRPEQLSPLGRLLRRTRLDELPQLLSVLAGDMSLIGPRPLLPADQPVDPSIRLAVRPGITGWAQVNGGNLMTAEEKDALDEYYVRNASFGFDLKIIWMTLKVILGGERRDASALRRALVHRQPQ